MFCKKTPYVLEPVDHCVKYYRLFLSLAMFLLISTHAHPNSTVGGNSLSDTPIEIDFCQWPLFDDFCNDLYGDDPALSQSGQDLIKRHGMTIDLYGILDVDIAQVQVWHLVNFELVSAFAESLPGDFVLYHDFDMSVVTSIVSEEQKDFTVKYFLEGIDGATRTIKMNCFLSQVNDLALTKADSH